MAGEITRSQLQGTGYTPTSDIVDKDITHNSSAIPDKYKKLEASAVVDAEKGDFEAAVSKLSEILELYNDYASAYNNRAQVYRLLGQTKSALNDLEKAIEFGDATTLGHAYTQRAIIKKSMGDADAAYQDFVSGSKYGNEVAKKAAVHENPYAKLCNATVSEAMRLYREGTNTIENARLLQQLQKAERQIMELSIENTSLIIELAAVRKYQKVSEINYRTKLESIYESVAKKLRTLARDLEGLNYLGSDPCSRPSVQGSSTIRVVGNINTQPTYPDPNTHLKSSTTRKKQNLNRSCESNHDSNAGEVRCTQLSSKLPTIREDDRENRESRTTSLGNPDSNISKKSNTKTSTPECQNKTNKASNEPPVQDTKNESIRPRRRATTHPTNYKLPALNSSENEQLISPLPTALYGYEGSTSSNAQALATRQASENEAGPPQDSLNNESIEEPVNMVVYWCCILLGISMLLPWNAFITAYDFFYIKFKGSRYQSNFTNYFSLCYTLFTLAFNTYVAFTLRKETLSRRIILGLGLCVATFSVATIFPALEGLGGTNAFYFSILMLIVAALATGLAQTSLCAYCSPLPPIYMQGLMSGQAVAGVLASTAQLVTAYITNMYATDGDIYSTPSALHIATTRPPAVNRAILYFAFVTLTSIIGLASFFVLRRHPLYHQYASRPQEQPSSAQISGGPNQPDNTTIEPIPFNTLKSTIVLIRPYVHSMALVFTVTLSLYPTITTLVKSSFSEERSAKSHPVPFLNECHFIFYNLGDLAGRQLSSKPRVFRYFENQARIKKAVYLRWLFVPIILSCNVVYSGNSRSPLFPTWIRVDGLFLIIVLLLGLTNGLFCSLIMMHGPKSIIASPPPGSNTDNGGGNGLENSSVESAGGALALFLTIGLALGSIASFPVRALGCVCNPFD
ncbi:hypothetical protein H4219_001326 [Mycoemilia scoparia]|uniref:Uncharacterized protein n=1 Tax=Mycoemilia scoparia TaxID=417184 RepID=A0A9W8DVG2_9FUNG|nr:hypothetical protein H4219_001326 [Mycoemilia scoparia]